MVPGSSRSGRLVAAATTTLATLVASALLRVPAADAFPQPAVSVKSATYTAMPVTWPDRAKRMPAAKIGSTYFQLPAAVRGDAQDIAVGHDGNLWITTSCAGTIVRLTPKGVATDFTYGQAGQCDTSTSITPGPDGAMWFADRFANVIGKITPKGTITTYALPSASPCNFYPAAPLGIVEGGDGAMWFTLTYPGNIVCDPSGALAPGVGRITTKGKMSFYYTAPPGTANAAAPERITAGPDGNLYFTLQTYQGGNELAAGEITTNGAMTFVPGFGYTDNVNDYLTFGPDGRLWVTDGFDAAIFVVGSQGAVAQYPVGFYGATQEAAYGLTTGPDGALWFTTNDDNELGRITTTGQVSFSPTASCSPSNCGVGGGITLRRKALWYALPGNHADEDVGEASKLP